MILEPIVYERVPGGWKVPEPERETWDALIAQREARGGVYASREPAPRLEQAPKELQRLVAECEAWFELSGFLEAELRSAYERDPLKTTRIVDDVLRGCEQRRLSSPGGLLRTLLRRVG